MFAFTPRALLAACERYAPAVATCARTVWQPLPARSAESMLEIDAAVFAAAPDLSIDYAVMEKAAADGLVAVVRGDFDWSDVGSWQAISELSDADADGNRGSGERVAIDTRGTFVHSEDRCRRDHRRREPHDRRHAGCRAHRASRPSAAREGSGRRVEGTRP